MNIFQVTTTKRVFNEKTGKVKNRTMTTEIAFPSTAEEITFRQWCDYFKEKESDPDWAKEMEKLPSEKQLELMATWDDEKWLEYYLLILRYLSCFTKSDLKDLANAPLMGDGGNGLISIYLMIIGLINSYEPKVVESFVYKGDTYVIDEIDNASQWGKYGKNLTANQVIDGLQYEHVFGVRDGQGNYLVEDRRFQVDVALIAVLTKKVNHDGSLDERPLDMVKRDKWTRQKIEHFMDASMTIALDVAFFLRNSKSSLKNILILSSFSKLSKQSLMPRD